METENSPKLVALECDNDHIIHRKGSNDYPEYRRMRVRQDDAENWEIIPATFAAAADARNRKLEEIDAYDTSDTVNGFTLDGTPMWLDKATRVGLVNSVNATELIGGELITLWYGTVSFELPLALARQLLAALEVYALACFNVTAGHRAAIGAMTDAAEIEAYDITAGYPAQPQFSSSAGTI